MAATAPPGATRLGGPAGDLGAPPLAQAQDPRTAARTPMAVPLLRYGALGLPLAFVALPLVVQWPAHAAAHSGLSLALLGALLLLVRLSDAVIDPWIGRRADAWFARSARTAWWALAGASLVLVGGFAALFLPSAGTWGEWPMAARIAAAAAALWVTMLAYSVAQIVHQAWAARLGGDAATRARWVGAREACALLGVLVASVLPGWIGWPLTTLALGLLLVLALALLRGLPVTADDGGEALARADGASDALPVAAAAAATGRSMPAAVARVNRQARAASSASPWQVPAFRRLLVAYLVNGLASALPASLVLFFLRDRLQVPPSLEGAFLAAYFGAAALGVPVWIRVVARHGLVRAWLMGMVLSIAAFAGAAALGPGDAIAFAVVCLASGLALGADLVAPAALLAGVLRAAGVQGQAEGRWFGWWSMATKLNLALAAGLALPLVQALGYVPGGRDPQPLLALALAYAVVPCVIKAVAVALVWTWRQDWNDEPGRATA